MKKPSKLSERYSYRENDLGFGFVLENPKFDLPPFGMVKFSVIAISEMWGYYEDFLLINVDGIDHEESIGLEIDVVGSPVKIFAGKVTENESEEMSILR